MRRSEIKKGLAEWQLWIKEIEQATASGLPIGESKEAKEKRIKRNLGSYREFVQYYFPHLATVRTPDFHVKEAEAIRADPNARRVVEMFRGGAKSVHLDVILPLYLKAQPKRELNYMVLIGPSQDTARRLLGDLQAELEGNQRYILDFGEQVKFGSWAEGEFATNDGCYFVALGRGQKPRGLRYGKHRPDYVVFDDLDDDEIVLNPARMDKLWRWMKTAVYRTLSPEWGRIIIVGNRISDSGTIAKFAQDRNWHHVKVNVLDKKGRSVWPEFYPPEKIEEMRREMGELYFQAEMMNNPVREGSVFKREHIHFTPPLAPSQYRRIVCYIDPSYRANKTSDYKAAVVWAKTKEGRFHCLDAFVRRSEMIELMEWLYHFHKAKGDKWGVEYYVEDVFAQKDFFFGELERAEAARGERMSVRSDKRKKPNKEARITAMAALWERGLVYYNSELQGNTDLEESITQLLAFGPGSRAADDAPDATEGAIWILNKSGATAKSLKKVKTITTDTFRY